MDALNLEVVRRAAVGRRSTPLHSMHVSMVMALFDLSVGMYATVRKDAQHALGAACGLFVQVGHVWFRLPHLPFTLTLILSHHYRCAAR
jgi:hypothetical protein